MKNFIAIPLILLFLSCQSTVKKEATKIKNERKTPDHTVALKFINDYTQNRVGNVIDWPIVSEKFKSELKRIINKAEKEAPGYGLGFDPVIDAQDYPLSGFKLSATNDISSEFVTVSCKEWKNFDITVKLIWKNDKWLVDGSGIINIPTEKQAER